jgi:polysaccharide biosynthesis transport protein
MTADERILRQLLANPARLAALAGFVVVVMLLTYGASGLLPRTYEARALLAVGPAIGGGAAPGLNDLLAYQRLARTYADLGGSRAIGEVAHRQLNMTGSVSDLLLRYTTSAGGESVYIDVRARDGDPNQAARIAEAVAEALVAASPLVGDEPGAPRLLVVVDPAITPDSQIAPRPAVITLVSGVVAMFGGISVLIWLEARDRPIRRRRDVELAVGLPVLAWVGGSSSDPERIGPLLLREIPDSPGAAAIHQLSGHLLLARLHGVRSILVTSAVRREGRTTVATNLAIALADTGRSIVLLDGDGSGSGLRRLFSLPDRGGLSSLLRDDNLEADLADELVPSPYRNLWLLPAGPTSSSASALIGSPRFSRLHRELEDRVDMIIIDGRSIDAGTDTHLLAATVDGTILVASAMETSIRSLRDSVAQLTAVGANVLGAVVIQATRDSATVGLGERAARSQ